MIKHTYDQNHQIDQQRVTTVDKGLRDTSTKVGWTLIMEQGPFVTEVYEGEYWRRWVGNRQFSNFGDWCAAILPYSHRKAKAVIQCYKMLHDLGMSKQTQKRACRIGWTLLECLVPIVKNEACLVGWLDYIERFEVNTVILRQSISAVRDGVPFSANDIYVEFENNTPVVKTKPKPKEPAVADEAKRQRIRDIAADAKARVKKDKASGASEEDGGEEEFFDPTEDPGEQEEAPKKTRLAQTVVFSNIEDLTVVAKAAEQVANNLDKSMGLGSAMALMATHWLSTASTASAGGLATQVERTLRLIERQYGVSCVVVDGDSILRRAYEIMSKWDLSNYNDPQLKLVIEDMRRVFINEPQKPST